MIPGRTLGLLLVVLFLTGLTQNSFADRIPSNIKQIVTFVYVEQEKPKDKATGDRLSGLCQDTKLESSIFLCATGTAFFVGVPDSTNPDQHYVYLVTAKHVLFDGETHSLHQRIVTRLNKRGGGVLRGSIPLVSEGEHKTVYFHSDPTVDLAVIPHGWPKSDILDGTYFPENLISDKPSLKTLHIEEGAEVFFTGLFTPHIGTMRNYPIFRFGHLALVTEEKINWNGQLTELYLMESGSYGGNSGSPVFFFLDRDRPPEVLRDGPLRLAGVMMGAFLESQLDPLIAESKDGEIKQLEVEGRGISALNKAKIGIAAVVPSYKLLEVLHGKELEERRQSKLNK
jgi:hypothetical protein